MEFQHHHVVWAWASQLARLGVESDVFKTAEVGLTISAYLAPEGRGGNVAEEHKRAVDMSVGVHSGTALSHADLDDCAIELCLGGKRARLEGVGEVRKHHECNATGDSCSDVQKKLDMKHLAEILEVGPDTRGVGRSSEVCDVNVPHGTNRGGRRGRPWVDCEWKARRQCAAADVVGGGSSS